MLSQTAELALLVHFSQTFTDTMQRDQASQTGVDRWRCGKKRGISAVEQDVGFSHQSQNPRSLQDTDHPDFPPASCLSQHAWLCELFDFVTVSLCCWQPDCPLSSSLCFSSCLCFLSSPREPAKAYCAVLLTLKSFSLRICHLSLLRLFSPHAVLGTCSTLWSGLPRA